MRPPPPPPDDEQPYPDGERRLPQNRAIRKLIERMDADRLARQAVEAQVSTMADELEEATRKLAGVVSYAWLVPALGAAALAIVAAVWALLGPMRDDVKALRKDTADDVRQVRSETAATVQRIETKVDALYRSSVEGRPRAQVRAEAEQRLEDLPKPDAGTRRP